MSDWTWEYDPDADHVVGDKGDGAGLSPEDKAEAEKIARELADAASVRYTGPPMYGEPAVSRLKSFARGLLIVWYQEDRRDDVIVIVRVTAPWSK
ncbi:hypothetical protein [Streptomyces fradiae]|uniref:hypothetical protein n=1 Tax=Streptomyces fradiae TaxID=1906 RepID=UPI0035187DBB